MTGQTSPNPHRAPRPTAAHPTTAPPGLTLSAERLSVTTEVLPYRRAVLRVHTTTEQVMVPVTLTRQHARVEYVDIDPLTATPVDPPLGAPETGAATAWLTLTVDEPVISTRPVPTERVRLVTEWVTGTQELHAQVSHEVLTADATDDRARREP